MEERSGGSRESPRPASLPRPRPRWMVVLGTWMCVSAAWLLFSAISSYQAMRGQRPVPAVASEDQEVARAYRQMSDEFDRRHPTARKVHTASAVVVSLALLWAVAALISLDLRGRRAAIGAALLALAYYVGTAIFELTVVRHGVLAAAPALARAMAKQAGEGAPSVEQLTSFAAGFMVVYPLVTGAFGVLSSALVLVYFGGRRGRRYYGLEAAGVDGR